MIVRKKLIIASVLCVVFMAVEVTGKSFLIFGMSFNIKFLNFFPGGILSNSLAIGNINIERNECKG